MKETYLKQAKTTTIIVALISLLQALLAITGFVTVLLSINERETLKLTEKMIRSALLNTSINVIFFVLFTVLFLLAYRRLKKQLSVKLFVYYLYIAFMVFSVVLSGVNGGFSLSGLLIPLMLILLTIAGIFSVKKWEQTPE
ncbi:hypothetical protein MFLO_06149 [Listeria floridensis FSL S10-1187]|uniref:DUF4064 domain-containing protein n=1 Tax=Listeria floridensis FSL S10-1187 TaxID=1265817 RepID=A0ABP3B0S0_9LIST|nr:hypothetical protein [Listeria floridensis]EUJ32847.1 hypothetical protein MFLO_06149 [Listeria floridensis FSL S10-1187]